MWYGSCDALYTSALRNIDNFHVFPNTEEGRRAVNKLSDICRDSWVVVVNDCFYVALSIPARDALLDKIIMIFDRKMIKLQALERECNDLKQSIEVLSY